MEAIQVTNDGEQINKMWYIPTVEYYSAFKKEGNSAIYNNINEPWGHYAKWNKLVTKKQVLYDFTYSRYLE